MHHFVTIPALKFNWNYVVPEINEDNLEEGSGDFDPKLIAEVHRKTVRLLEENAELKLQLEGCNWINQAGKKNMSRQPQVGAGQIASHNKRLERIIFYLSGSCLCLSALVVFFTFIYLK